MSSYDSPKIDDKAFVCPHCGVLSQVERLPVPRSIEKSLDAFGTAYRYRVEEFYGTYTYLVTRCANCGGLHFWDHKRLVYPTTSGIVPSEFMPDNVRSVFEEAQHIVNVSPRAACAMLRICLERLVVGLGAKGDNLDKKVKSLGLSPRMQKMCDVCRLAGNEAVHREGFDFSLSNPEALALAYASSEFVNILCEAFIGTETKANAFSNTLEEIRQKNR